MAGETLFSPFPIRLFGKIVQNSDGLSQIILWRLLYGYRSALTTRQNCDDVSLDCASDTHKNTGLASSKLAQVLTKEFYERDLVYK